LVFVLWLVTRADPLPMVGMYTIYGGLVAVALGFACLCVHVARSRITRHLSWGAAARECVLPLSLLLINFPAACGYTWTAIAIETRYVVTVTNESSFTVNGFVVRGGGCEADFDVLLPGERRSRGFHIQHDGDLQYEGAVGGTQVHGVVDGYVTPGLGGRMNILIRSQESVEVRKGGT